MAAVLRACLALCALGAAQSAIAAEPLCPHTAAVPPGVCASYTFVFETVDHSEQVSAGERPCLRKHKASRLG